MVMLHLKSRVVVLGSRPLGDRAKAATRKDAQKAVEMRLAKPLLVTSITTGLRMVRRR